MLFRVSSRGFPFARRRRERSATWFHRAWPDNIRERGDKIDPSTATAKSLIFRIPLAPCASHLEKILYVLEAGRSLKARRSVSPLAILSISLTAIKVMPYEIDRPHKIVSSPFVTSARTVLETNDRRRFIPRDTIDPSISRSAIRFMPLTYPYAFAVPRWSPADFFRATRARDYRKCRSIPPAIKRRNIELP